MKNAASGRLKRFEQRKFLDRVGQVKHANLFYDHSYMYNLQACQDRQTDKHHCLKFLISPKLRVAMISSSSGQPCDLNVI